MAPRLFTRSPAHTSGRSLSKRSVAVETGSRYGINSAMEPEWNAEQAFTWGYYANVYVYACARANGEDLAGMPFRAGASADSPTDWNPDAPLAVLLGPPPGTPSPVCTAEQLIGWSVVQLRIAGRFAWEIVYTGDRVTGLWPLPASRIKPVPSSSGDSYWSHFEYDTGRGTKKLSTEQVLYHWRQAQHDPRQPESTLQAARLDVSVAVMQDRYDVAFLKNDARPAALIVHEAFAEKEEEDAWKQDFRDKFSGPDNAGKAMFIAANQSGQGAAVKDAIHVETLGLSQKDARFIERYEKKILGITVAFGTPMTRIGDASGRTFSNASEEAKGYWQHTVWNLGKDVQAAINLQLAPKLGSEVGWFETLDIDALQPAPKFEANDIPGLRAAKVISLNESRARLGLPPVEWGDDLEEPEEQPPALAPPDEIVVELDETEEPAALTAASPALLRWSVPARQERAIEVNLGQIDVLERRFQRDMQRLFDRQQRETIRRLEGKRGRQTVRADAGPPSADGLFDATFWLFETEQMAMPLFEQIFGAAAVNVGVGFDVDSPRARAFIGSRTNQLAGNVTETTYKGIQKALAEGAGEGKSIPGLAGDIRALFEQTYVKRAETVARTEVISAYNGATWETGEESDQVSGFEWLATLDNRVRPSHSRAHGQVIRQGELFDVGGSQMRYPGDPAGGPHEVINCRCTVLALTPEEMAERELDSLLGDLNGALALATS